MKSCKTKARKKGKSHEDDMACWTHIDIKFNGKCILNMYNAHNIRIIWEDPLLLLPHCITLSKDCGVGCVYVDSVYSFYLLSFLSCLYTFFLPHHPSFHFSFHFSFSLEAGQKKTWSLKLEIEYPKWNSKPINFFENESEEESPTTTITTAYSCSAAVAIILS